MKGLTRPQPPLFHSKNSASAQSSSLCLEQGSKHNIETHYDAPKENRRKGISQLIGLQQNYFITPSITKGAFGKFRIGQTPQGELLGVKEFRGHECKKNLCHKKTKESHKDAILKELNYQNQFSSGLPIRNLINVKGKYYAFMPLMNGNLHSLSKNLPTEHKKDFGWFVLLTIAQDLQKMHDRGMIHRDVKLTNILFNGQSVYLSDYGIASTFSEKIKKPLGTLPMIPPEMLKHQQSVTTDTWSLGITILALLSNGHILLDPESTLTKKHPLRDWKEKSNFSFCIKQLYSRHLQFQKWRCKGITTPHPQNKKPSSIRTFNQKTIESYLSHARFIAPELTQFVIERMLDPNPKTRANTGEVITFAKKRACSKKTIASILHQHQQDAIRERRWNVDQLTKARQKTLYGEDPRTQKTSTPKHQNDDQDRLEEDEILTEISV